MYLDEEKITRNIFSPTNENQKELKGLLSNCLFLSALQGFLFYFYFY
jgi:hypothetical protein